VRFRRLGAATMALTAGADIRTVQELLGHPNYAFTAATYTCVTSERLRELAQGNATLLLAAVAEHRTT
jgi:site-specific recombinase XerD